MLRKGILAGAGICVVIVAYSVLRYPGILASPAAPRFLPLFLIAVIWYGLAAVRWTHVTNSEDFVVLHYGARWGVVIGLAWIVEVFAGNVLMPHSPIGLLVTIVAAVLPVVAGATGAAVTGQTWTGARIGFWSGVVSGLIAFAGVAAVGYLIAYFPEFLPDREIPSGIGNTAAELAAYSIGDYLAGGVSHLLLVGALFCSAAGAFGGLFGRLVRSPRTHWLSH
jgi:hypothetical protein